MDKSYLKSKKFLAIFVLFGLLLGLSSCVPGQVNWNDLTKDQQARFLINDAQDRLNRLFNTGKQYIIVHPDNEPYWKSTIVPMFDQANKTLKELIDLQGQVTPITVSSKMDPLIDQITEYLIRINAVKGG